MNALIIRDYTSQNRRSQKIIRKELLFRIVVCILHAVPTFVRSLMGKMGKSSMCTQRIRLVFLAMLAVFPVAVMAQTQTVKASLAIVAPGAACSVASSDSLYFGTITRPTTGSGLSVTVNAVDGTVSTSAGLDDPVDHQVGAMSVTAVHTDQITVTGTFPAALDGLTYARSWAASDEAATGYSEVDGDSYEEGDLGGVGVTATRYFRFGGTVSNIAATTDYGHYDADISLSIACVQ